MDAYFESQFYPSAVTSTNNTYNRINLFPQIIASDLRNSVNDTGALGDGYPVCSVASRTLPTAGPNTQFSISPTTLTAAPTLYQLFQIAHPMAVVPSNPDRFSRLIPTGSNSAVSMTGVSTIPSAGYRFSSSRI